MLTEHLAADIPTATAEIDNKFWLKDEKNTLLWILIYKHLHEIVLIN